MRLLTLSLSVALPACGSGGGGGGGGTGPALLPNFDSIQSMIIDPLCTGCHVGATAPLGLRLDSANSYALLVGVPSVQQPGLLRVDPGNPNDSYLIQKLEGTAMGGQMPLGGTPLPAADIAVVRQWITDGAQPPPGTPPVAPIRVSSLSPLPGSTVPMVPMSIMAVFDRELSASTVDLNTFVVERSGGDGSFGDGNEVGVTPVSVTVPLANPMTAVFDMSTTMPANDTYRVTLVGAGPTTIQDLSGNSLDGEFAGTFPSGDGTAGGDFTADFVVAGIQPTLTSIQDNVFTPICSGCHTGGGGVLPASMDLTSLSLSFMNLVNVASVQNAGVDRVEPGDPDSSYLIRKIEGTAATGLRMPPLGNALDQETIDAIRQWISDGAAM
jgi:mono/diheme cytochrome c family protein